MATKTSVQYVSDISGKDITDNDAPTVAFSYDGSDYTIDLTADEAEKFYKAMEPYLSVATKVSAKRGGRRNTKATTSGPTPAEIRLWAEQNGIDVPSRGRIPQTVYDAYNAK